MIDIVLLAGAVLVLLLMLDGATGGNARSRIKSGGPIQTIVGLAIIILVVLWQH